MKTCALLIAAFGFVFTLNGCMGMPSKSDAKGTSQFTNPSKHHPYPVRAKNRANQKH
jgi:hypothetical protein